jgi:hypothetical protein
MSSTAVVGSEMNWLEIELDTILESKYKNNTIW